MRLLRASVAAILLVAGGAAVASADDSVSGGPVPVIMVHGYSSGACPGSDAGGDWVGLYFELFGRAWPGPLLPVTYYACDTDGVDITGYGPNVPAGATPTITQTAPRVAYTQDTPIETIAHDLAWFVYDTYSAYHQTVDLVGASMGGLVLRYALAEIGAGATGFPPYLDVSQAVSVSAPNDGVDDAAICGSTVQCQEMSVGSAFVAVLQAAGTGPSGVAWTALGSSAGCDIVPAASALDIPGAQQVDFGSPCYNHDGYLTDSSTADTATTTVSQEGEPTLVSHSAPHALVWLTLQLEGDAPGRQSDPPPDTTPPAVTIGSLPRFTTSTSVRVGYAATDTGTGVASFDARYRSGMWDGTLSGYRYPPAWQHRSTDAVTVMPVPGQEYCVSVRARDAAGNVSPWTAPRCTAAPVDDRRLSALTVGWRRATAASAYLHTLTEARAGGGSLRLHGVTGSVLALVVERCPACGPVAVYLDGKLWRTISTYAATRRREVVLTQPALPSATARTVTLRAAGVHGVAIDGLGVTRS